MISGRPQVLTIVGGRPRVCAFYGVVIYMYWNERDHPVAHFHAYHAGRRASVSADGMCSRRSTTPHTSLRSRSIQRPEPSSGPNGIDLAPEPLYEQAKAHPLLAA
jgi:Domain of unknown function (DUF4160)